ncbi:hypothetical protein CFSAN002367_05028 [Clostridium botulinum CFSAN002367]|nr:hypothetical protein CFSAN002369_02789 [Clostridium botulinum CFSAN002369]EPS51737.1 hypothetical protein CFSAN002367_05028 [Clostridium botulinum CFSAN002367]
MEEIKNINYIENTIRDSSMVLIYFHQMKNVMSVLPLKIK